MIKRESLHKKLAIAAMAGMLMLLLAALCVAQTPLNQTPLNMGGQENCTNCSANASSSPGLDNVAQETVLANASVRQVLEAPLLKEPKGIKNTGKLTYRWVDDGNCMFYCLEVMDGQDDVVLKQCYEASDVLSDMNGYYVTPSESLGPGTYTWRILCSNCGDDIESDPMEFTVCTSSSFPGRATLVSPKDTIGSMSPTFVWMPVTGCTQYRLKVAEANHQNEPIFMSDYLNVEDVFSDTEKLCSITPDLGQDLVPGIYYRWWIQTINCKGDGPWSYYKSFRYLVRPPGKSTPLSPRGLISTDTPIFTWTAASAATTYHLELINYQNDVDVPVMEGDFDADKVTKGSRCSGSLGSLPDDDPVYYWRIQANNDAYPHDPNDPDESWTGSDWKYFETNCAFKPGTDAKKARMG
jgi:hypothetical protein